MQTLRARLENDIFVAISRVELLYRILLVNLFVVLSGALFGTWLTQQTVQAGQFTIVTYLVFILAAMMVSAVVNLVVLQMALRPLVSLQRTVRERTAGNQAARAQLGAGADPDVLRLAAAVNEMLDDLDQKTSLIERNNGQLTLLAAAVIQAQEQERQRLARELHDNAGQALSMVVMGLERGLQAMPEEQKRPREVLAKLRDVAAQTLDDIRNLALDLRPAMLDDLGLEPTLRWYLRRYQETSQLEVAADLPAWDTRLPAEVETTIFRIVQEAMANVTRHAQAHRVTVSLRRLDNEVTAVISDDGLGFDVEQVRDGLSGGHMGLIGMRERAELLGGSIHVQSAPGRGTTIAVMIPLARSASVEDTGNRPAR